MNNEFFLIYLFNSLSENSLDLGGLYGAVSLRSYNLSLKILGRRTTRSRYFGEDIIKYRY